MNGRRDQDNDDDEDQECVHKSEQDEWLEDDNTRRYNDWESDNRRPY